MIKRIKDSEGQMVNVPTRAHLEDQRKLIAERRANLAGSVARIVADPGKLDNLFYNYDLTLAFALEFAEDEPRGVEITASKIPWPHMPQR